FLPHARERDGNVFLGGAVKWADFPLGSRPDDHSTSRRSNSNARASKRPLPANARTGARWAFGAAAEWYKGLAADPALPIEPSPQLRFRFAHELGREKERRAFCLDHEGACPPRPSRNLPLAHGPEAM